MMWIRPVGIAAMVWLWLCYYGAFMTARLLVLDAFTTLNSTAAWQQSILLPEFKVVITWFFEYLKQSSTLIQSAAQP